MCISRTGYAVRLRVKETQLDLVHFYTYTHRPRAGSAIVNQVCLVAYYAKLVAATL
jgi:hypothetical protein